MPLAGQSIVNAAALRRYTKLVCPSLGTVQEYTESMPTGYGSTVKTWTDLPDHVDLPCRVAPVTGSGQSTGATSGEVRADDGTYDVDARTVIIAGFYPDITESHRFVVDGTDTYDIVDAASDGDSVLTRLRVRKVSGNEGVG